MVNWRHAPDDLLTRVPVHAPHSVGRKACVRRTSPTSTGSKSLVWRGSGVPIAIILSLMSTARERQREEMNDLW
jgi:hypothetical protein